MTNMNIISALAKFNGLLVAMQAERVHLDIRRLEASLAHAREMLSILEDAEEVEDLSTAISHVQEIGCTVEGVRAADVSASVPFHAKLTELDWDISHRVLVALRALQHANCLLIEASEVFEDDRVDSDF